MKIAAIVPMRHSSERVPGKNYRPFGGKPLYHRIIGSLLACPQIGVVIIDTDSPTIIADAAEHFPTVKVIERPERLRGGMVQTRKLHLGLAIVTSFYEVLTTMAAGALVASIAFFLQPPPKLVILRSLPRRFER